MLVSFSLPVSLCSVLCRHSESDPLLSLVTANDVSGLEKFLQTWKPDGGSAKAEAALCQATHQGHVECVRLMILHKISCTQTSQSGFPPIYIAAANGSLDLLELLLASKASPNQPERKRSTPLLVAANHGNLSAVQVLLENKADVQLANNEGATPLDLACSFRHLLVAKTLVCHGAKLTSTTKRLLSPQAVEMLTNVDELKKSLPPLSFIRSCINSANDLWNKHFKQVHLFDPALVGR